MICYILPERNYIKRIRNLIEDYDNPGRELGLYIKKSEVFASLRMTIVVMFFI
jgi:hypothetical protein